MKKRTLIIGLIALTLIIVIMVLLLNKGKTYNVTFKTDGGTIIESQKVKKGGKIKRPIDPEKEGYVFDEWIYLDEVYDFNSEVNSDMTLSASWIMFGDINLDGIVDDKDADYFSKYLTHWEGYELNDQAFKNADLDMDGEVNGKDYIILQRHLADWKEYRVLPY